jgi:hypothetical protein
MMSAFLMALVLGQGISMVEKVPTLRMEPKVKELRFPGSKVVKERTSVSPNKAFKLRVRDLRLSDGASLSVETMIAAKSGVELWSDAKPGQRIAIQASDSGTAFEILTMTPPTPNRTFVMIMATGPDGGPQPGVELVQANPSWTSSTILGLLNEKALEVHPMKGATMVDVEGISMPWLGSEQVTITRTDGQAINLKLERREHFMPMWMVVR